MRRITSALKLLTFVSLAMTTLSVPTEAATAPTIPSRNQIVEKIESEVPILGGNYVLVTYQDTAFDSTGKVVNTTTRESVLPFQDAKGVETTQVVIQTISGSLATVLVPTKTLDERIKVMMRAPNIVRLYAVGGELIENTKYASYAGFHFNQGGSLYDTPWNADDSDIVSRVNHTKGFTDVAEGHWSEGAINLLSNKEIVRGIGDGKFAPTALVTRAEFFTMMFGVGQAAGIDLSTQATLPADISEAKWSETYASKIKGYVDVQEKGAFDKILLSEKSLKPNQPITRAEAAQFMSFFVHGDSKSNWKFTDWNGGVEPERMARLYELGAISGSGDASFDPNGKLTREQMASLAARILFVH